LKFTISKNILQKMLANRQINGSSRGEVADLVFNINQEYKILVSQTLLGDKVRMFNNSLCVL